MVGPSIKDVRSQEVWGGLPSTDILRTSEEGGFFRCGRPALFGVKNKNFSKFMVCPHGQGGVEPVRTFFGQGEGDQFFTILC